MTILITFRVIPHDEALMGSNNSILMFMLTAFVPGESVLAFTLIERAAYNTTRGR